MLYINLTKFAKTIDLLEFLSTIEDFDLIVWFFPESKLRSICGIGIAPKDLVEGEPVTTYGDDFRPKKTRRERLTSKLISIIRKSEKELQAHCDSLVLYKPGEKSWFSCTIGHEGICLLKDETLIEILTSNGFDATSKKPDWW